MNIHKKKTIKTGAPYEVYVQTKITGQVRTANKKSLAICCKKERTKMDSAKKFKYTIMRNERAGSSATDRRKKTPIEDRLDTTHSRSGHWKPVCVDMVHQTPLCDHWVECKTVSSSYSRSSHFKSPDTSISIGR